MCRAVFEFRHGVNSVLYTFQAAGPGKMTKIVVGLGGKCALLQLEPDTSRI